MKSRKKLSLAVIEGMDIGKKFPIAKPRTIIGSSTKADIILRDKTVAETHAALEVHQDQYILQDLGSNKGTRVNNECIDSQTIEHTSEIRLGDCRLLFIVTEPDFLDSVETPVGDETLGSTVPIPVVKMPAVQDLSPKDIRSSGDDADKNETRATITSAAMKTGKRPAVSLSFQFLSGPKKGRIVVLSDPVIIIGRGSQASLDIDDAEASRKHCSIEIMSETNVFVKDLSSANGTTLNDNRISNSRLKHGDILHIGSTRMKVSINTDQH